MSISQLGHFLILALLGILIIAAFVLIMQIWLEFRDPLALLLFSCMSCVVIGFFLLWYFHA